MKTALLGVIAAAAVVAAAGIWTMHLRNVREDRVGLIVKVETLKRLVPAVNAGVESGGGREGAYALCAELEARRADLEQQGLLTAFEETTRNFAGMAASRIASVR